MDEQTFDHEASGFGAGSDGTFDGRCYDYGEMLDELRCHTSESVELARLEAVAEQRWWHLRELAALRVLDERGAVDDSLAGQGRHPDRAMCAGSARPRRTAARSSRSWRRPRRRGSSPRSSSTMRRTSRVRIPTKTNVGRRMRRTGRPRTSRRRSGNSARPPRRMGRRVARRGSCGSGGDPTTGCSTAGSRCPTSTVRSSSRSSTR